MLALPPYSELFHLYVEEQIADSPQTKCHLCFNTLFDIGILKGSKNHGIEI